MTDKSKSIKDLWEISTNSSWPKPGKFTAGEYDRHLTKFAELIIKECIRINLESFENDPYKRPDGNTNVQADGTAMIFAKATVNMMALACPSTST